MTWSDSKGKPRCKCSTSHKSHRRASLDLNLHVLRSDDTFVYSSPLVQKNSLRTVLCLCLYQSSSVSSYDCYKRLPHSDYEASPCKSVKKWHTVKWVFWAAVCRKDESNWTHFLHSLSASLLWINKFLMEHNRVIKGFLRHMPHHLKECYNFLR